MSIMRTNVKKSCDSTVMNYFKLEEFRKEIKNNTIANLTIEDMVAKICQRRIGCGLNKPAIISQFRQQKTEVDDGRLIRVSTPLEYVRPADIPSPSESKADSISLPSDSQMQREKERIARERNVETDKEKEAQAKSGHKRTKSHLVGNDTIKEETISTIASTDGGKKEGAIQVRVKGGYDIQKMKQNAAREARVKLNKMVNKSGTVDYLTQARNNRSNSNEPNAAFDWSEILRKSLQRQKQ